MNWSDYQKAIFDFNLNSQGHGFVNAKAGSGKTTVIEECARQVDGSVLAIAFNKHIQSELKERLPNKDTYTLHAFGLQVYRRYHSCVIQEKKVFNIVKKKLKKSYKIAYIVAKMVSLYKGGINFYPNKDTTEKLMEDFDINLPKGLDFDSFHNLCLDAFEISNNNLSVIDFDDMVFLPLYLGLDIPQYDYVYADEAQDFSPAQTKLSRKAIGGKAIYVGDPRQSIYRFRGADKESVSKIITGLSCTLLPLSVSYRCSKSVVEEAKQIEPEIEAYEGNEQGYVGDAEIADIKDNSMVLCRTNAPLIPLCLSFVRQGRRATVRGGGIGDYLNYILDNVVEYNLPIHEGLEKFREESKSKRKTRLDDNIEALHYISTQASTIDGMRNLISKIFTDFTSGITFSTVHKAKGLESENVYILKPDTLPYSDSEEEWNLKYVAVTRAKKNLFYLKG